MTRKITILEIDGKNRTVFWQPNVTPEWVNIASDIRWITDGVAHYLIEYPYHIRAVALPALPLHPTPKDAPLLHRYMAEDIVIKGTYKYMSPFSQSPLQHKVIFNEYDLRAVGQRSEKITHAIDSLTAETTEIAIDG